MNELKKPTNTTVVNMRDTQEYDVCIDRRSPFGNPFKMKGKSDEERQRVIEEYREYLNNDINLQYKILAICAGKVLGCWCKPKACHGDVIVEFIDNWELM